MPQPFQPSSVLLVKLALVAMAAATMALLAFGLLWSPAEGVPVDAMNTQPIPFSHKHHVGDDGLDCRMCHATVEAAATPGMPSAQLCLTCHSKLFADQPMFEPLRRSVATHQPIAWAHVNRLPDYVYFDHSVHVHKGVACQECHGRIDQMPLVAKPQPMTMKWCISCHEDPLPHLHAAGEVFAMPSPRLADVGPASALLTIKLEPRARLTDCSTCHR